MFVWIVSWVQPRCFHGGWIIHGLGRPHLARRTSSEAKALLRPQLPGSCCNMSLCSCKMLNGVSVSPASPTGIPVYIRVTSMSPHPRRFSKSSSYPAPWGLLTQPATSRVGSCHSPCPAFTWVSACLPREGSVFPLMDSPLQLNLSRVGGSPEHGSRPSSLSTLFLYGNHVTLKLHVSSICHDSQVPTFLSSPLRSLTGVTNGKLVRFCPPTTLLPSSQA